MGIENRQKRHHWTEGLPANAIEGLKVAESVNCVLAMYGWIPNTGIRADRANNYV